MKPLILHVMVDKISALITPDEVSRYFHIQHVSNRSKNTSARVLIMSTQREIYFWILLNQIKLTTKLQPEQLLFGYIPLGQFSPEKKSD